MVLAQRQHGGRAPEVYDPARLEQLFGQLMAQLAQQEGEIAALKERCAAAETTAARVGDLEAQLRSLRFALGAADAPNAFTARKTEPHTAKQPIALTPRRRSTFVMQFQVSPMQRCNTSASSAGARSEPE